MFGFKKNKKAAADKKVPAKAPAATATAVVKEPEALKKDPPNAKEVKKTPAKAAPKVAETKAPPAKTAPKTAEAKKTSAKAAPSTAKKAASETVSTASKGLFEIKIGNDGRYMFNMRAGNTQVIANSQMYTSKASCMNGINSVGVNAPIAPVEDQTLATVNKEKCPKFQIYFDKAGKYRFNLLAANGDNILSCTQGYTQKSSCVKGINSVIANAHAAIVLANDD